MEDVSTYGHVAMRPSVRLATTQQLVTITVVVSRAWVSAVHMDIKARGAEVGVARRGGLALAVCAAVLLLTGPAVQAAPRAQEGLPGPRPGCPPQQGVVAPAAAPWAQQELGFASVWKRTRGGGVTVAVVDSGVDANPQFGDRVIPGPDLVAGTKPGIPPGADCVGHGTAVASIIAAAPVPGVSFTGVAPAARILSVKISGTDTFPTSVTPQGIMDAVQFGADVINLSLATPDDVQGLRNAVEYALRHNVVVVAAAGNDIGQGGTDANDANDGTGPFYPAAYPGVLAVGAIGPGGVLAGFSDRYTPVGVTAPGVNVTSAYPGTFPAAYDAAQNGTSFAAAFVSGVVALVRSAHPGLNAAQVVARIEATAHGGTSPGTGHGMVDPVRAVTAVLPAEQAGAAGHQASAAPSGLSTRTVALAAIVGAFGLVVVVLTAVLVIRRRRGTGPSGRHAG
jgi:type VII secretion-associated serine protease mycosin